MNDNELVKPEQTKTLWPWIVGLLVFVALGIAYQGLIEREILGFIHDDAIYAITGKSLIHGKGYLLEHVVTTPHQLKYPLVLPTLLAGVWFFFTKFPANLVAMTQVPLVAGALGMGLLVPYLVRVERFPLWLAFMLTFICGLNFYWLFHTTAIMAEGPYFLLSLLTLWAAANWHTQQQSQSEGLPLFQQRGFWVTLLLGALSFHTRSIGVTLIGAIALFQLLHRRWWTSIIFFGASMLLTMIPWSIRNAFHASDYSNLTAKPFLQAYANYGAELVNNAVGNHYVGTVTQSLGELIARLMELMFPVFKYGLELMQLDIENIPVWVFLSQALLATGLAYGLLLFFLWQGWQGIKSRRWSLPGLYLAIYLTLICLWNYDNQVARFLSVVLPFLWVVMVNRLLRWEKPLSEWLPSGIPRLPVIAVSRKLSIGALCAFIFMTLSIPPAFTGFRSLSVIRREHWIDTGGFRDFWPEYKDALQFVRQHVPMSTPVAAEWDTVFYLYTGRPTYYLYYPSVLRRGGQILSETWPTLMKSMLEHHVGYMAIEPEVHNHQITNPENTVGVKLLDTYPQCFEFVYQTPKKSISLHKLKADCDLTPRKPEP